MHSHNIKISSEITAENLRFNYNGDIIIKLGSNFYWQYKKFISSQHENHNYRRRYSHLGMYEKKDVAALEKTFYELSKKKSPDNNDSSNRST